MTIPNMTTRTARKTVEAAGHYIREGSYRNTTDDRLGRWYIGNTREVGFRPCGSGYPSQAAAWRAAAQAEHDAAMNDPCNAKAEA